MASDVYPRHVLFVPIVLRSSVPRSRRRVRGHDSLLHLHEATKWTFRIHLTVDTRNKKVCALGNLRWLNYCKTKIETRHETRRVSITRFADLPIATVEFLVLVCQDKLWFSIKRNTATWHRL